MSNAQHSIWQVGHDGRLRLRAERMQDAKTLLGTRQTIPQGRQKRAGNTTTIPQGQQKRRWEHGNQSIGRNKPLPAAQLFNILKLMAKTGSSAIQVTVGPNSLKFVGVLDESVTTEELTSALAKLQTQPVVSPITLDLSKVTYANSPGLRIWFSFLKESKAEFKYVEAPVWLVTQFSTMKGYFDNGSYVESVQVPFYAPETNESLIRTLVLGKDVPIQKDYESFQVPNKNIDGREYELDVSPKRYFSFIAVNFELFSSKIKAA